MKLEWKVFPLPPDIAPLYFNLFALMRESDRTWFPPNHVFKTSQSATENLQFRLRYVHLDCSTLRIILLFFKSLVFFPV